MRWILLFIFFIPASVNAQEFYVRLKPEVISKTKSIAEGTLCVGDEIKIDYDSNVASPTDTKYMVTGGTVTKDNDNHLYWNTTDVAAGEYFFIIQIFYSKYSKTGRKVCDSKCYVYDAVRVILNACGTTAECSESHNLIITKNVDRFSKGDLIKLKVENPFEGKNYNERFVWSSSNGKIISSGAEAWLDTNNIDYNVSEIKISVFAETDHKSCTASGFIFVDKLNETKPSPVYTCVFAPSLSRVDNRCKALATDLIRKLELNPLSKIELTGTYTGSEQSSTGDKRAERMKTVFTDGGLGIKTDFNKVEIKPSVKDKEYKVFIKIID